MITVAGVLLGIALIPIAARQEVFLRAALFAQIADLVTFAAVWEHAQGELNPLSHLVRDVGDALFGEASGAGVLVAWLVLTGLKVGLLAFLIRIDPSLARYRSLVLAVAVGAGIVGTVSNVIAHPNDTSLLLVLVPFVIVAIRAPGRYHQLVRIGAGVGLSTLLAIGGLVALASIPYLDHPVVCAQIGCPPGIGSVLTVLSTALFASAMVGLTITARFAWRLRSNQLAHAD